MFKQVEIVLTTLYLVLSAALLAAMVFRIRGALVRPAARMPVGPTPRERMLRPGANERAFSRGPLGAQTRNVVPLSKGIAPIPGSLEGITCRPRRLCRNPNGMAVDITFDVNIRIPFL